MVKSVNLKKTFSPELIEETKRDGGAARRLQGYGNQYDAVLEKQQQSNLFLPPKRSSLNVHRRVNHLIHRFFQTDKK